MTLQLATSFDVSLWRKLVAESANGAFGGSGTPTSIAPFGFEVFRDSDFVHRRLRRFYCYISVGAMADSVRREAEERFVLDLAEKIKRADAGLGGRLAVLAVRSGRHWLLRDRPYTCLSDDVLLVAEARPDVDDIHVDYANYLLGAIGGLAAGTLPEHDRVEYRAMARTRIFQLFLIWERLLTRIWPATCTVPPEYRKAMLSHRSGLQFYYSEELTEPMDAQESAIVKFAREASGRICEALEQDGRARGDLFEISVPAYHGDRALTVKMSRAYHVDLAREIGDSYLACGSPRQA